MRRLSTSCAMAALLLSGCSFMHIQHDYDPDVDFSRYATFAWMPMTPEQTGTRESLSGPFVDKRIRQALVENLSAAGLRYVTEDADVLVAYQLHYVNRSEVRTHHGYGYIHAPYPHAIDVHQVREGTLIVDLVDPQTTELIWRGWSVSDVHRTSDPRKEQGNIDLAIRKILERFPPYATGSQR